MRELKYKRVLKCLERGCERDKGSDLVQLLAAERLKKRLTDLKVEQF